MKHGFGLGAIALAAFVLAASASAALPGRVVSSSSASGRVAIARSHTDVNRPKALYVRLAGERISSATMTVGCVKSFAGAVKSYTRSKPGVYRIPIQPPGADSCRVTASVGGSGRIVIEVRVIR